MLELVQARIVLEKGRGVLVECRLEDGEQRTLWFPRSHLELDGETVCATSWIVNRKEDAHDIRLLVAAARC